MLEIDGVSKSFGGLQALSQVSLGLEKGRIYGLIGPNGSGKTTLFNVITGVIPATSGTVRFGGREITNAAPHVIARLGISRTYQLVRPFFELTAAENVEVGLFYGRSTAVARRDVHAESKRLLDFVGLGASLTHAADELNLGERKRLEIAKALAANPQLTLFDEALAGLNATEIVQSIELFRRINEMGITIFMIEHNMPGHHDGVRSYLRATPRRDDRRGTAREDFPGPRGYRGVPGQGGLQIETAAARQCLRSAT